MKAQVQWVGEGRYTGLTQSNNSVVMDTSPENKVGGSPMELVLVALGGCSSVDVVSILKKARQTIHDCHVDVEAERADSVPAVFTKIHLNFVVKGQGVNEAQVERAVQLSADKYCSVALMLGKGDVKITHSFEVHEG